jgi:ribose transport system permease protein
MTSMTPGSPAATTQDELPVTPVQVARVSAHRVRSVQIGRLAVLGTYVLLVVVLLVLRPSVFSEWSTWSAILQQSAIPIIVATGLTLTLIAGDFDLSIGAVLGFGMAVSVSLMATVGLAWPLSCVIAVGACALVGVVNGGLVTRFGVNSFIGTLAIASVVGGLEALFTGQATISTGVPQGFSSFGTKSIFGMSIAFWVAVVVSLALFVVVAQSEWGRFLYATGENREASRLAGVRVRGIRTWGFVSGGVAAGVGGILLAAQNASYYPNAGSGYLLPAYAAAFLGTALAAGRFGVLSTVFGVLFLQTLQSGLTVLNVPPWIVMVIQGLVLIVAVMVSALGVRSRRST